MNMTAKEYRALVGKGKVGRESKSKFRRSAEVDRTIDGIVFDSKAEASRYADLRNLERAGEIIGLQRGQEYPLVVNGTVIGSYTPDFEYRTPTNGVVIEEVKSGTSGKEKDYRLRRRVFEASTGLQVTEVLVK